MRVLPDAARYVTDCVPPLPASRTLGYLAEQYTVILLAVIRDCNLDRRAIRAWAAEQKETPP